jgi:hypothetical protein
LIFDFPAKNIIIVPERSLLNASSAVRVGGNRAIGAFVVTFTKRVDRCIEIVDAASVSQTRVEILVAED